MATTARLTTPSMFERACRELQEQGLIEGAVLISRDGFPLAGRAPGAGDLEVFAAMHATALGAAEVALAGIGASHGVTLVAEHLGRRFVSRGVTPSLFVVACMAAEADCRVVVRWMDSLAPMLS